jgi:hypothetical protein
LFNFGIISHNMTIHLITKLPVATVGPLWKNNYWGSLKYISSLQHFGNIKYETACEGSPSDEPNQPLKVPNSSSIYCRIRLYKRGTPPLD